MGISDHAVMTFNVHVYTPTTGQAQPKYRYHKGNYASMNDQLNGVDWSLMDNLSVQEAWTFFYTTCEKAMEQFIPKSVPTKDPRKILWMNHTALSLHKKKRHVWLKYKLTKS